ncbi:hypothetical protein [Streptomyces vietnamensis]|uniref:Uncharacterized protein n=1 Tax=Streptomyces vietnamensis TaxID=362257 RepID=A0A0B5IAR3_9ACTN|nr:hypothetical protein [Streptomyces vietnamensis]AJF66763.1 hypothetical protein SVTN_22705 [Streptomyces vietnamensis]
MNLRSSWVAETGQTREDTRLNQVGATTMINPVQVRSGILPGSYDGKWRLSGFWMDKASAMTATVSEGRAVIQGDISQGVYPVSLPASEQITFAAGDAQYGRIDLVVLKVYDNLYDGSTRNEAKIEIIQGVPGQAPKAPVAPPRSLPIYEVTVPAGASAGNGGIPWNTALKDLRTPVVALGGILPVEGPVLPGAHPGQYQDTANNQLQRWDGGKWVAYPEAVGGIVPSSASTLQGSYTGQYRDGTNGELQRYDGAAWRAAFPGPYYKDLTDAGYTTSSTYTSTLLDTLAGPVQVNFVAPSSKAVIVHYGARMRGSKDLYSYLALRLTQGTTVVQEPVDDYAVIVASDTSTTQSMNRRLSGLTPGLTYTLTLHYRIVANAVNAQSWYDNAFIRVDPQY